ncbi:MAG TPA: hypothetical protein PKE69_23970 [Pyrinomonadaceae bacterium]|nr:hypothetical protein [Pyrinomonadaceae bacterium]
MDFDATGDPYAVTVYGYIDGFRAAKRQTIGDTKTTISLETSQTETVVKKNTPDPRYDYKYEYKFTDGKLAEMQMIYNTGEEGMRYVYNYSGNRMEKLAYTDKGELNQKYLTVFDAKGYEIEWTDFILYEKPVGKEKHIIKNETLDKQGNWTKRTYFKVEIKKGKEVLKPARIEYRTITYY